MKKCISIIMFTLILAIGLSGCGLSKKDKTDKNKEKYYLERIDSYREYLKEYESKYDVEAGIALDKKRLPVMWVVMNENQDNSVIRLVSYNNTDKKIEVLGEQKIDNDAEEFSIIPNKDHLLVKCGSNYIIYDEEKKELYSNDSTDIISEYTGVIYKRDDKNKTITYVGELTQLVEKSSFVSNDGNGYFSEDVFEMNCANEDVIKITASKIYDYGWELKQYGINLVKDLSFESLLDKLYRKPAYTVGDLEITYYSIELGYAIEKFDKNMLETNEDNKQETIAYADLTDDKSPLKGYWQAEDAGMIIEYSLQDKNEGFSIYFLSTKEYSKFICERKNYIVSGTSNTVECRELLGGETYTIKVVDENNIIFKSPENEYNFVRTEVNEELFKPYLGKWVSAGETFGSENSDYIKPGVVCEMIYCEECKGVHESQYDHYAEYNYDEVILTIFDGAKLRRWTIRNSVFDAESTSPVYAFDDYTLEGDKLEMIQLTDGPVNAVYFREDAEELKYAEVFEAYEEFYEYRDDIYFGDHMKCSMIYFNDDDIPELLFDDTSGDGGIGIVTYSNGEWVEFSGGRVYDLGYVERKNIAVVSDQYGTYVMKYDDSGNYIETIMSEEYSYETEDAVYELNGIECEMDEFYNAYDKLDITYVRDSCISVKEAWQALQNK